MNKITRSKDELRRVKVRGLTVFYENRKKAASSYRFHPVIRMDYLCDDDMHAKVHWFLSCADMPLVELLPEQEGAETLADHVFSQCRKLKKRLTRLVHFFLDKENIRQ